MSFTSTAPGKPTYHQYILTGNPLTQSANEVNITDALLISGACTTAYNTTYTYTSGTSVSADKNLINSTSLDATTVYCYFTIEFSNVNTTYYQEYVYSNSSYVKTYVDQPNTQNRYFAADTSGNSNCYANWSFNVISLKISIS